MTNLQAIDLDYNPDQQMPMPFAAADAYAQQVMRWAREASDAGLRVIQNVAYGADRLQRYDVFAPLGAKAAPVLVFWHGGGWTNGYRDYVRFMAEHVVKLGCVLVAPSYRLVPHVHLHSAFEDSVATLAHVVRHAAAYGGAPDQLYLAGHSAGGHLAALVALRLASYAAAGVPAGAVRGCLPMSGIMDLHHPSPAAGSLEERVYSMVLASPEHDALLSPICWTAGNRVTFDLTLGEHDSERVRRSNARMLAILQAQQGAVCLHSMAGQSHFDTHAALRDGSAAWYARLAAMLVTR
jgi:arylformamidase